MFGSILDLPTVSLSGAAAFEPITIAELKTHLRITGTDDDTYLTSLVTAARQTVESWTGRALAQQTFTLRRRTFPDRDFFELPRSPLISVTSVVYLDADGVAQTLSASTAYEVLIHPVPGRIVLRYGQDWPSTRDVHDSVTVTFVAGYASAGTVPEMLKHAVKFLAAWWYEQRLHVNIGNIVNTLPDALDAIVAMNRVVWLYP